jgi:hypothetical protein
LTSAAEAHDEPATANAAARPRVVVCFTKAPPNLNSVL